MTVGQHYHFGFNTLIQEKMAAANGRLNAGLVGIEHQHDLLGKPLEQTNVALTKGRAQSGNHIFNTSRVKRQQVEITLNYKNAPTLAAVGHRDRNTVKRASFVENGRFR